MSATLGIDAYHLTTLIAHADQGRLDHRVAMCFFFRSMPRARNYVVFCGLRQVLAHAASMHFDAKDLETIRQHPILGPALAARPAVWQALERLDGFEGDIDALPEGTLAYAGPGIRTTGEPFIVAGTQVILYTPLIQTRTDMVRAKLIETPWLSRMNYCSMVASKAARVVTAAKGKPVVEFGQRRTHNDAAVDAAYAAWIAGCASTSNMRALQAYGIPATGTMDHFFVQATERPGIAPAKTEHEAFQAIFQTFGESIVMLVDTYDTPRGIRTAVQATNGALAGVRLDSNVTPELVRQARALLDQLGAHHAKIFVSDQLDEYRVAALAEAGADAFGVGENITCVPDAATGIGAVGKIVVNGYGKVTMKLSRGSGKATLPGLLQVYRFGDHDLIATAEEPAPPGGRPLLQPAWRGRSAVGIGREPPTAARERLRAEIAALPEHLRGLSTEHQRPWPLVVSDALATRIETCVKEIEHEE